MMDASETPIKAGPAALVVIAPNGNRGRVGIEPLPFRIGRNPENDLVLRDSRISRTHARIVFEEGAYYVEDCASRHGLYVNGAKVSKRRLDNSDKIEFGASDSYALEFTEGAELKELLDRMDTAPTSASLPAIGSGLAKLRAILDHARAMQSSLSIDDVLASAVDTALAITGAERGFLMLKSPDGLQIRVARGRDGRALPESELKTPRAVLTRALERRRELLYMSFDPMSGDESQVSRSVADLELRSVICVPLVRIRTTRSDSTTTLSAGGETVGLLYMDSRLNPADLAGGNRELVQTLAIEASTLLENARLLEEERMKQRLEEELRVARSIQLSLLPAELPKDGWLRASGASMASRMVGGDYFDVTAVNPDCWSAVVADVSGKGVGSALLASLLQGALITATEQPASLGRRMQRLNQFLIARTGGEKYATIFYCLIERVGKLSYVNAAHCPPLVIRGGEIRSEMEATGMPVGLIESATYDVAETQLQPGDKLIIYSDGVTEAQNATGEFFGKTRLKEVVAAHQLESCEVIIQAIKDCISSFTEDAPQSDDITMLALEYAG